MSIFPSWLAFAHVRLVQIQPLVFISLELFHILFHLAIATLCCILLGINLLEQHKVMPYKYEMFYSMNQVSSQHLRREL